MIGPKEKDLKQDRQVDRVSEHSVVHQKQLIKIYLDKIGDILKKLFEIMPYEILL